VDSFLDAISAFLLKHPRGEFARGDLVFAPVVPGLLLLALMLGFAMLAAWLVGRLRGASAADRLVLGGTRVAAFLLVGFCLTRPTLVLSRAVAHRNVLAVVLDDTRSMAITDVDGASRLAAVQAAFGDSSSVMRRLAERFAVRVYRGAATATAMPGASSLRGQGSRTDLPAALAAVREGLADMPLAGMIVVSDGAHNGDSDLDAELLRLASIGIPVHTVGVGESRFERDLAVEALRLPDEVLIGGEAPGEVVLALRGVAGRPAVLSIEAGGRLVGVDTVQLPADRELVVVPIRVPAVEPGVLAVRVSAAPIAGEMTLLNNHASVVLRVRQGPEKILYVEGEPRPELPFLRRAIAPDSALQLVALVRTARDKHLRLGVDDSLELVTGFPTRREELFRYRAVILGSIEAGYFTGEQLRMLQDFVGQRGGGLLALGGRAALAEGGYAGTPLDEVLPVVLPSGAPSGDDAPALPVVVRRTTAGREHPALELGSANVTPFDSLPPLTVVNLAGEVRPGATVLLEGELPAGGSMPLFAVQRYGRGKSAVLLVQDLWRWQMRHDAEVEDITHAALWDRILRWAVAGVPDALQLDASPSLAAPGEPVELRARITDSTYTPRDDARVTVRVVPPDAVAYDVPLLPDLAAAGEYAGRFTPASAGGYRLELTAVRGRDTLTARGLVVSDADRSDPGRMERDDALLARIAERTGGVNHDIAEVDRLPDEVALTRSGITARASHDLWDAPLVFFLFLLLLGFDWGWRRMRGLA
jgi:uncharacterized membrane protein